MTAIATAFLTVGVALPILPLHVHQRLGFGTFIVGVVVGSQFAASLASRIWAGGHSDRHGAKRAVQVGLLTAAASGGLYLVSLAFTSSPALSVGILLVGRTVLGGAESFIITGGVSWGLGLVHGAHAGKVIAWIGMAMFAALAAGAPLGSALYATGGFTAIALATVVVPLVAFAMLWRVPEVPRTSFSDTRAWRPVLRAVWMPGVGAAFSSLGYGTVLAFGTLLFVQQGWQPVWLAFSAFAVALILTRMAFGHWPDRFGGAKVALATLIVEAVGLALIGLASGVATATAGALLIGLGYSLVYPGFGLEAVRAAPQESRGLAMGIFTAFLDVALGLGTPAFGWIAGDTNLSAVFVVSAMAVLCAVPIAIGLLVKRHGDKAPM